MIGKRERTGGRGQKAIVVAPAQSLNETQDNSAPSPSTARCSSPLPSALCPLPTSRGFTLLELMIVISILVILALIALPQYNRTVLQAREATLRQNLFEMRKLLDQYAADKGKLPQSLDDLVTAGYMREIPVDPMTEQRDWVLVTGEDPNSTEGGQGITDICSASTDTAADGSQYNDCTKW